eukprot:1516582-Alexandrium_andersonii.AAC.1
MSASLVGSEMCIRDSVQTERPADGNAVMVISALRWPLAVGARRCSSAVSYTHLTLPTICSV